MFYFMFFFLDEGYNSNIVNFKCIGIWENWVNVNV